MDIKNFVLSYYKNSADNFHIHKVEKTVEAQKPHTHEYFQIYFISKGALEHHVENESAQLNQGDMFIIPPGAIHYISPKPNTVFYSFSFMEDFILSQSGAGKLVKSFIHSLTTDESKQIKPKVTISREEILYVESIMAHILREFSEKPIAYSDTVGAYALLLITMLAREYFSNNAHGISEHFESNKQFVLHCVEYIESNFADNISLDEIAKRSAMSKSNFCSLFLSLTGHSFKSYLNKCRIKAAANYIKKGYKITAIFGLCGYNDFSTFNRNFNKIMGMSPREYKNILGE